MKLRMLLPILFVFVSVAAVAQKNTAVLVLKNDKATFSQSEHGSVTLFQLKCTPAELKEIQGKAADYADRFTLTSKNTGKNLYDCVLTINHQNHPEYVHKMLIMMGISSFEFEGKIYPMMQFVDKLKSIGK